MFWPLVLALALALASGFIFILTLVQNAASTGLLAIFFPMTPSRASSIDPTAKALTLAKTGRMDEAANEFDQLLLRAGDDTTILRQAIEFHVSSGGHHRAAELLIRLRSLASATRSDELYATQRLIDLYLGALDRPERALVEMRRLVERFPNTPDGEGARAELQRRKMLGNLERPGA